MSEAYVGGGAGGSIQRITNIAGNNTGTQTFSGFSGTPNAIYILCSSGIQYGLYQQALISLWIDTTAASGSITGIAHNGSAVSGTYTLSNGTITITLSGYTFTFNYAIICITK